MDNYYLFIVGFLGILLVCFVVFYLLKRNNSSTIENMNVSTIEKHIKEDSGIKCDGDKCVRIGKYERCDDESCF